MTTTVQQFDRVRYDVVERGEARTVMGTVQDVTTHGQVFVSRETGKGQPKLDIFENDIGMSVLPARRFRAPSHDE